MIRLNDKVRLSFVLAAYVCANALANVSVSTFGIEALPITAFALIPFDMASRDCLHERWSENNLKTRMFFLILASALLTYLVNHNAKDVAMASCVSFTVAAIIDTAVYHALKGRTRFFKMNASNAASALTDSIVFPLLAFGMIDPSIALTQSGLKFAGGAIWAVILTKILL